MFGVSCLLLALLYLVSGAAKDCPAKHDGDGIECHGLHSASTSPGQDKILLSSQWTVIGPFPAGLREHQLGAFPALTMYPLTTLFNTCHPLQLPSLYGKAGKVEAKKMCSVSLCDDESLLSSSQIAQVVNISYPDVDFSPIRQSTGWSGAQWQALSASDFTVEGQSTVTVGVNLGSGAEFAIVSEEEYMNYSWQDPMRHTKWYNGDWYGYGKEGLQRGSEIPMHFLPIDPGKYKVMVKSVYEIRVFGDFSNSYPSTVFEIHMRIVNAREDADLQAVTTAPFGVTPDVVHGTFAGWGVSFGLSNIGGSAIEIVRMAIVGEAAMYLEKQEDGGIQAPFRIDYLQTRPAKMKIKNLKPLPTSVRTLEIKITYRTSNGKGLSPFSTRSAIARLHLEHIYNKTSMDIQERSSWDQTIFGLDLHPLQDECLVYKYTYLDSDQTVQYASVIPPKTISRNGKNEEKRPVVLYLHGAGAGVEGCSTLQQNQSWVIQPMGRSTWGYDWQTISQTSAVTALKEFALNLYGLSEKAKHDAATLDTTKVMIVGHSNGGQGVYHYASLRPDELIGVIVGAGYISLNDYVPMTWQVGRHFNDAAMNGILRSSLNAFENDGFASNLAGLPLLIKYGSMDDNVPIWHSKEMASLVSTWNRHSSAQEDLVRVSEVVNKSHHWPHFMQEDDVQNAIYERIESGLNPHYHMPLPLNRFTLTVFNVEDSKGKQGWRITQMETPGRMARLEVEDVESGFKVRTVKVSSLQVRVNEDTARLSPIRFDMDGKTLELTLNEREMYTNRVIKLEKTKKGWQVQKEEDSRSRPTGPMIRFLSSSGPIQVILPTDCSTEITKQYQSIARRFSIDAYVYGRLDVIIRFDNETIDDGDELQLDSSNILLLGGPTINALSRRVTALQTLIHFLDASSQFQIQDRIFDLATTLLTLMPHPAEQRHAKEDHRKPMALLLHGTDPLAIERGYSLLPVRTGTLLPEWIVVDKSSMWKGYGGVVGAGWFNHHWGWSESMSYLN